jgi:hypothetical protein
MRSRSGAPRGARARCVPDQARHESLAKEIHRRGSWKGLEDVELEDNNKVVRVSAQKRHTSKLAGGRSFRAGQDSLGYASAPHPNKTTCRLGFRLIT